MDDVQKASSQRLVMERLTDELRGAMVYPFLQIGIQGQIDQVRFLTASLPGPAVWTPPDVTENPLPAEQDLQFVGYRLRTLKDDNGDVVFDDQGQPVILGLERTCQKQFVQTATEGKEITVAFLSPHVKFLYFRFWDGAAWTESWSGSDLPLAVEINLGAEQLPAGVMPDQYPYELQQRLVYVPGGKKALSGGTILQGLGAGSGP